MKNFENLKKTFIIAEIGNNHEGNYKNALKLIDKAKKSGVDAVKFQTFETKNFLNKSEKKRFDILKSFELKKDNFKKLSIYARKKGLKFISTPLDIYSAKYLSSIVDIFKISSGDNNYFQLIEKVLSFKKPIIISTGLLDYSGIVDLLKLIKKKKLSNEKSIFFTLCV